MHTSNDLLVPASRRAVVLPRVANCRSAAAAAAAPPSTNAHSPASTPSTLPSWPAGSRAAMAVRSASSGCLASRADWRPATPATGWTPAPAAWAVTAAAAADSAAAASPTTWPAVSPVRSDPSPWYCPVITELGVMTVWDGSSPTDSTTIWPGPTVTVPVTPSANTCDPANSLSPSNRGYRASRPRAARWAAASAAPISARPAAVVGTLSGWPPAPPGT